MIIALDAVVVGRNKGEKRLATNPDANGKQKVTSPFLDIGHDEETTSASLRSQMAEDMFKGFFNQGNEIANAYVREIFESIFVRTTKFRTDPSGKTVFIAELESSKGNKSKAFQDQEKAGSFQKALNRMLEDQAAGFPNQPDSDSPVEVLEKRVVNALVGEKSKKPRSTKNVKIRKKSTVKKKKVNNKGGKGKSSPVKVNAVAAAPFKEAKTRRRSTSSKSRVSKSPTSIVAMIGIFNQQLPNRVMKNMGAPRLTNRTGTFANSVRVTDITKTAQGFPSIGYTYQKSPYQTFEVGGRQGSTDYDPRNLINQSIREIAVQFAMGRFYTRRM
jgi:hypothetical protein